MFHGDTKDASIFMVQQNVQVVGTTSIFGVGIATADA